MNRRHTTLYGCIALVSILTGGCAAWRPSVEIPAVVPGIIEGEILNDMADVLVNRFPPATTQMTLKEQAQRPDIDALLRSRGYEVHEKGNTNEFQFAAYYLEDTGRYLGIMRVGLNFTLSRQYVYDDGKLLAGASTVADGGKDE